MLYSLIIVIVLFSGSGDGSVESKFYSKEFSTLNLCQQALNSLNQNFYQQFDKPMSYKRVHYSLNCVKTKS